MPTPQVPKPVLLQPFEDFHTRYVDRLLQLGRRYLVSQTYFRAQAADEDPFGSRINLLLSDYAEPGEAKLHLNAVRTDRYAAIIDLGKTTHLNKIKEMAAPGSGYRLFIAIVRHAKELESRINRDYRNKFKQYVDNHTNWRISHDAVVTPSVQLSFGELYIILKHGSQRIRIKFSEIEQ
jgi:hypothetical protein